MPKGRRLQKSEVGKASQTRKPASIDNPFDPPELLMPCQTLATLVMKHTEGNGLHPTAIEPLSFGRSFVLSPAFKQVTAMSPLQYQKQLRLMEARRPILTEDFDAIAAAYQVGYESPSQFSREYVRLFGAPPIRDIERLRTA